jgi:hypothetical protein
MGEVKVHHAAPLTLFQGIPMNSREEARLAHARRRWMLPNASLWLRPDYQKWVRPEPTWRAADFYERKYNADQPRVPKGNPDGGEWTSGGAIGSASRSDRVRLAANKRTPATGTVTDAEGRPHYQRGGHHEMPESVYQKWNLQPETAGPLPATYRETPEGPRIGNIWGQLHDAYNDGVTELSQDFFSRNGIRPDGSNMTPDQARELLGRIRQSEDPRIRDFNYNMRRIQRLFRLRGGSDD